MKSTWGEKKEKKEKEIVLDASLVGIFPIFPTKFIMNTLLTTGHMNANRLWNSQWTIEHCNFNVSAALDRTWISACSRW